MLLSLHAGSAARGTEVDTWRCSSVVISRGDPDSKVLEKCGEPTARETVTEPIYARNASGGTRQIGAVERELWTYDRSNRIPVRLTFEEGKLVSIESLDP
ncbi:MAG TPA: DUF2845 domain-containing protein [Gammaproteobacteria bacterium]